MNQVTPETYSNGREDTHYIFLSTDWPEVVALDGRVFDAESLTITFGEEAPLPGDAIPNYSCVVVVEPDCATDGKPEWQGKAPSRSYSHHASGPNKGLAPQWVVDIVIRHRPEWYPRDPMLIPRPERTLKAV